MYLTFFFLFSLSFSPSRQCLSRNTTALDTYLQYNIYIDTYITFQVLVLHSSHELTLPQPLSPLRRTRQQPLISPPPHTRKTTYTTHHLWRPLHFLSALYIIIIIILLIIIYIVRVCKR